MQSAELLINHRARWERRDKTINAQRTLPFGPEPFGARATGHESLMEWRVLSGEKLLTFPLDFFRVVALVAVDGGFF